MTQITFPVGRMVWGSVYNPQTTDFDGAPLTIKTGPQKGQPTQRFAFGVAIPKNGEQHFSQTAWGATMWQIGHGAFPNGAAQRQDFAWKITDGDSPQPNKRNQRPCDQTGYAGHWIVAFSSTFPPKLYNADGTQALVQQDAIKCGYYVQVHGNVSGNKNDSNPGIYVNHELVALAGYGEEIHTGADPRSVGFGGPLPAGATQVPAGGFNPAPAQPQGAPQYAPPPPPGGQPQYAQPPAQGAYPAPGGAPQYAPQPPQYSAPAPGGQPQYAPMAPPPPQPNAYAPAGAPQYAPPPPPGQHAPMAPPPNAYQPAGAPQYAPPPPPAAQYAPAPPPGGQPQYAPPPAHGVQPVPSFLNGPQY